MMFVPTYVLLGTAVSTALFHAMIPDHWLPFVLIGRARGWSLERTAAVSGASALLHTLLSVLLGLGALAIGLESAHALGQRLGRASAVLLVAFGLAYAGWAWRKGGHFHPGGALVHSQQEPAACAGAEGSSNPDHLYYHADTELIRGTSGRGDLYLALIVGLNPCILVLPILLATAEQGPVAVASITLAYSLTTIVLMVGLSVAGVAGSRGLPVPGAARYMEAASGLLIALVGIVFWMLEI